MEPTANTFINPSYQQKNTGSNGPKMIFKILMIILGLVVVGELVWFGYSFLKPSSSTGSANGNSTAVVPEANGTFSLAGPAAAKVGDTFQVTINMSSSEATDGVDLLIKYDPSLVSVQPQNNKAFNTTTIYSDFPSNVADNKKGVASLSGITSPGKTGFTGSGSLGTLTFKALKPGTANITVDFTPGSSVDSNIIGTKAGKDILKQVNNLSVTIK